MDSLRNVYEFEKRLKRVTHSDVNILVDHVFPLFLVGKESDAPGAGDDPVEACTGGQRTVNPRRVFYVETHIMLKIKPFFYASFRRRLHGGKLFPGCPNVFSRPGEGPPP